MPFLNLGGLKKRRSIYRITAVDRLVEGIHAGENVLVRPDRWDDPFENVIMNAVGVLPDGGQVAFRLRHNYFGQCWSLHKETDLMWRAYSPKRDGVKLRVGLRALYDSLAKHQGATAQTACFLGRVEYKGRTTFEQTLRRGFVLDPTNQSQARTLLVKRYGFSSEREVRLLAYSEDPSASEGLFRYSVDWNDMLMELVLDPRMETKRATRAKARIRDAGYAGKIIQSGLYREPPRLTLPVRADGDATMFGVPDSVS